MSDKPSCEENGRQDVFVIPVGDEKTNSRPDSSQLWRIDKEMLHFKLHFFLYIGGLGAAIPYIAVLAKDQIGISSSSFGAVLTAQMFLFTFSKPVIGYIADYFNKIKIIITVLVLLNVICNFLLLIIPSIEKDGSKIDNFRTLSHDTSDTCASLFVRVVRTSGEDHLPFCSNEAGHLLCALEIDESGFSNKSNSWTSKSVNDSFCNAQNNWMLGTVCCEMPRDNWTSFALAFETLEECILNSTDVLLEEEFLSAAVSGVHFETRNRLCFKLVPKNMTSTPYASIADPAGDFETYQFWAFATLFTFSSVCGNAVFTLSDTACMETVQKSGAEFGKQRLWGGIGWGILAPVSGFILDYTANYLVSWIIMASMLSLFLLNILKLDLVKPHFSKNILKDIGMVFRSTEFVFFEIIIFLSGMGTGIIWYYMAWFLTSIGGNKLVCGLSLTVQSFLGVIPFMFFSGWIIEKVGHYQVLIFSLIGYVIRFLWYSYLYNPWWVLPVEWLHGVTYGLYYTALASYGKKCAKPGTEATTQAVLFATNEGLGCGIGCVLAGIGFDSIGLHRTFFYASLIAAAGSTLSLLFIHFANKSKKVLPITQK